MKRIEGISGIYVIISLINGKYYVGSSYNLLGSKYGRLPEHSNRLRKGRHDNEHLNRACQKYGYENFVFFIVEYVEPDRLTEVEQKYLDVAKTHKEMVYNKKFTADKTGPMEEETKLKLSKKAKIRALDKTNHHQYGKPRTETTRNKISQTSKGRKLSSDHREKLRLIAQKKKGLPRLDFMGNKNPDYNHTVYTFWNFVDDQIFKGTKYDFRTKFGYSADSIDSVLRGRCFSIKKKWVITEIDSDNPEACKKLQFKTKRDSRRG